MEQGSPSQRCGSARCAAVGAAVHGVAVAAAVVAWCGAALAVCVGDCDADGRVVINELVLGVAIALGNEPSSACPGFQNAQGQVSIAQLIQGVNNALGGCPPDDGLLSGPPGGRALDAVRNEFSPDAYVRPEELSGPLIRTQVELAFRKDATVDAVNALLRRIDGRIVSSRRGVAIVVVRIPDPGSAAALEQLLARLAADPLVRAAERVLMSQPNVLPDTIDVNHGEAPLLRHHLAVRAHAAWNARAALAAASPPTLEIGDFFGGGPPDAMLYGPIDVPSDFATNPLSGANEHGYHVLGIAAGAFDGVGGPVLADSVTGMFPGPLPLRAVDIVGGPEGSLLPAPDMNVLMLELVEDTPGNVVLNTSLSTTCGETLEEVMVTCSRDAAFMRGVLWIEQVRGSDWPDDLTHDLEGKFLHATAAGNVTEAVGPLGADVSSEYNAASLISVDPLTLMVVPNLTNTLVVENFMSSADEPFQADCISSRSEQGGTIAAIGSPDVFSFTGPMTTGRLSGTSMATPQVAGLAAYVWALRPSLSPAELVALLRRAARPVPGCGNGLVIDAYAAVLAADEGNPTRPVRRAILDVADASGHEGRDGAFDEHDLDLFLAQLDPPAAGAIDYGRYDLNGDGVTGTPSAPSGSKRVDLDADGVCGLATLEVEGLPLRFDEEVPSDLKVLCYFAYSPLYTGDPQARRERLGLARCLDLRFETIFPATVRPEVNTLLSVRVSDLDTSDDMGDALGQAGVRIELTVTGGTVDDFVGTTNADGIFQTNARLFAGQPELTIQVVARAGENGPELARRTVRASASVGALDFELISLLGNGDGSFTLEVQKAGEDLSTKTRGTLDTVLPVLNSTLADARHVVQMTLSTAAGQPASFSLSAPTVDVDNFGVFADGTGSMLDLTFGTVSIGAGLVASGSTITARFADMGQLGLSGADSHFDVTALSASFSWRVGHEGADSNRLRADIHIDSADGASVFRCVDCAVTASGLITGGFAAGGNTNLSLGPLTLRDARTLELQDNSFARFDGISAGDITGFEPLVLIFDNTGLDLSKIHIGDITGDLTIQNNHGFTDADARAFAAARRVGGTVRISGNEAP